MPVSAERIATSSARSRKIAYWLDNAFRVPGTQIRFGLDPLMGLVPGLGDVVGGFLSAYIVIEAARPRALEQLDINAAQIVRSSPGLAWITITAHGAQGDQANWVGFGDDCGVAAGLSAALRSACGRTGFVGDAIADPLTGIFAALTAWDAWLSQRGGRFGVAMSHVVAHCLARARDEDSAALHECLRKWNAAVGKPFPRVQRRNIGSLPAFGEHTHAYLAQVARC